MINFFAPSNKLGTGVHALGMMRALAQRGHEICLIPPFGSVSVRDAQIDGWLANQHRFSKGDPSVMIFDPAFLTRFCGKPRIGFAVFETDALTPVQAAAIRSCDVILVPSEWGRSVLAENGITSFVVHEGFDPEEFKASFEPREGIFRFVHVGKFEERKGTLQTIRCFAKALEAERAELILHCRNPFLEDAGIGMIKGILSELRFMRSYTDCWLRGGLVVRLSFDDFGSISDIYRTADCGIFPSKGEGWGLPILECIASGTPAIVGNWTGQSEYISMGYPADLILINNGFETANDGVWFHGDRGNWVNVSNDDLIHKILWAFENTRALRFEGMWKETVDRIRGFTWDRSALQLDATLKDICG